MSNPKQDFITNFQQQGDCTIDIEKLCKKWNHLYFISQYKDIYRLVKQVRKDSPATAFKVQISQGQAKEIIEKCNLLIIFDSFFKNAATYKTKSQIESNIAKVEIALHEAKEEQKESLKDMLDSLKIAPCKMISLR